MRWVTSSVRAVFSARSIWRAIQYNWEATRLSIRVYLAGLRLGLSLHLRFVMIGASGLEHPGILGAPALRRIDHQRTFAQGDAGEPARNDAHGFAGQHERPEIDVPRGDAGGDEGRAGRQRERRLRDVFFRGGEDTFLERLALSLGAGRADQHAVAAGAVDFLDHQF